MMRINHINFISQSCREIKDNFNKHSSYSITDKVRAIFNKSVDLSLAGKQTRHETFKSTITSLCLEMEKRLKNNNIFYYEEAKRNPNINVINPINARELRNLSEVSDTRLYKQLIHYLNSNSFKELFVEIYKHHAEQYNLINLNKYADKDDFIAIINVLSLLYDFCDNKLAICKDMAYLFKEYCVNKSDSDICYD